MDTKVLVAIVAAVCVSLVGAVVYVGSRGGPESQEMREVREFMELVGEVEESDGPATLVMFHRINTGMTYQQVTSIVGEDGIETSSYTMPQFPGNGEDIYTDYEWEGDGGFASSMYVSFENSRVTSKMQIGLE